MTLLQKLSYSMPIWVSRKTTDGVISQLAVPLWLFVFIGIICLLNTLLWGCIGIYEAARVIV